MLGMSFLKEIVVKEYVTHPGVILRKLRKEIINTLKQKGEIGEQKDGMDMALISINHNTNKLQFSGANNPLYIIRKNTLQVVSKMENPLKIFDSKDISTPNKLYEIRPDKMPISIYDRMDRFTTHEIQLEAGDQLYMFSDGFADQFGGPKGKKFKYKAFKKLLLENSQKPMQEQKEILSNTFAFWRNEEEQVDDVVVVGIKI
jgi:serine phosphatase RsbU (regulator of sigma subunit)